MTPTYACTSEHAFAMELCHKSEDFFCLFHTFPKCCGASVMNLPELCLCPSGAAFRPSSASFVVECSMVIEMVVIFKRCIPQVLAVEHTQLLTLIGTWHHQVSNQSLDGRCDIETPLKLHQRHMSLLQSYMLPKSVSEIINVSMREEIVGQEVVLAHENQCKLNKSIGLQHANQAPFACSIPDIRTVG